MHKKCSFTRLDYKDSLYKQRVHDIYFTIFLLFYLCIQYDEIYKSLYFFLNDSDLFYYLKNVYSPIEDT